MENQKLEACYSEHSSTIFSEMLGEDENYQRLKKVNDHIRDDEIQALAARRAALDAHIGEAALRLDAVLLVVGS